jgi:spore coat protein A
MHFHLVNVEVISRHAWAFNPADGSPMLPLTPTGPELPVDENEMSGNAWKDTVRMNPGEVTTVRMKFDLPPTGGPPPHSPRLLATYGIKGSEYVWHCHILEHEEHDMMRPLVVI